MSDWVLVADTYGESRSALATVRALALAGFRAAATTSTRTSLAASSRHCGRAVPVTMITERGFAAESFAAAIHEETARHSYLTVIPTSDVALLALDAPGRDLVNKAALREKAHAASLEMPPTRIFPSFEAMMATADEFEYPVVVKAAVSPWAPFLAAGPGDLSRAAGTREALLVQPFVSEPIHAVSGVLWDGTLVAVAHQRYLRIWPPDCGTSCAAVTIEPDLGLEERVSTLLAGHRGIFQAQLAGPFLLDLNLRPYGSLPLAVAAGANLVGIYCELVRDGRDGEPAASPSRFDVQPVRARPGQFYRWLEADVRCVWRGVRDGQRSVWDGIRDLRPRLGAAHSTESLNDPAPMLARARFVLSKGR